MTYDAKIQGGILRWERYPVGATRREERVRKRLWRSCWFHTPPPCHSPAIHPQFESAPLGGIHVGFPQEVPIRLDAGNGAFGFVLARGGPGLHARGAAGLQRR